MSYFIDLVNQWRRDHRGGNGNTAIVYINLCGMKHYNRRFGFAEGDHLLRRFSGILERAFSQDNCSRFGFDHFCVFTTTDRLSGGTVLQAFLKNIALNPVTGANAIVIAILTITHPDNTHSPVSFTHLAKALTSDYLTLYYANIRTGRYVDYRGSDDFFASVRRSVRERVAPEDIEPLLSALTKENIMRSIEEMGSFVLFFRATVFGKMVPVNLKAVRIKHDRDHIIIGLREKKELIESDLQTDALR